MINKLRKLVSKHLLNYRGWTTERKIVVFESDDWGSIRVPSRESYNLLLDKGIPLDKNPYNRFDSLESETDLLELFNSLGKFSDFHNRYPIFTVNTVMANPDFNKIRESKFKNYYWEIFTQTYERYPEHGNCYKILKDGISEGLIQPQFHGREHLNVKLWLSLLRENNKDFREAFDHNFWGLSRDIYPDMQKNIQASFDMKSHEGIEFQKESIQEGLNIFKRIFGFRSKSFIANNFIWSSELNQTLYDQGVEYLQGMKYQKLPLNNTGKHQLIRHYLGEKNEWGQYYLIRNCAFEPSMYKYEERYKSVNECLNKIKTAFLWNKPAIITTHRLNFIGSIDLRNRVKNLSLLEDLLDKMLKRWPDIEFVSSDQLGDFMKYKN